MESRCHPNIGTLSLTLEMAVPAPSTAYFRSASWTVLALNYSDGTKTMELSTSWSSHFRSLTNGMM